MQTNLILTPRMGWIDAMRGFSMLVLLIGHVLPFMGIGFYNSFLGSLLLTFRMPLFFFISGFVSYRAIGWWNKKQIGETLKKKVQAQILCPIVFYTIYQLVYNKESISFYNGFYHYWFTIVLFQMFFCYLLLSLLYKFLKIDIVIPGLSILSVICLFIVAFNKGDSWFWQFLCWENFTKYMHFFTLGIICSKYREHFFKLISCNIFITVVTIGWSVCMLLWYNDGFRLNTPYAYSVVHDILVRYFALFTVVSAFFGNATKLSSTTKWCFGLRFIGQRTLDIYMIHWFFLPDLSFLSGFMQHDNLFVIQLLVSSLIAVLVLCVSIIISMLLRRSRTLEFWLFGVNGK